MEKRTYQLPAGEHAGNIGGEERIFVVPGTEGEETEVTLTDPGDIRFAEDTLGRVATHVESDEPEPEAVRPEPGDADPLANLSAEELRDQLRARGLSTSGSKAEMTARLREAVNLDDEEV